jgi:shikimate kinase
LLHADTIDQELEKLLPSAREFIDFWVENSVHSAEQYGTTGSPQNTTELVRRCVEMAESEGINRTELEAEVGDLREFISGKVLEANQDETSRSDRHRNI